MAASDVTATLELALQASGLDQVDSNQRPRLLSDNDHPILGPSHLAADLSNWLDNQGMLPSATFPSLGKQSPFNAAPKALSISTVY